VFVRKQMGWEYSGKRAEGKGGRVGNEVMEIERGRRVIVEYE
jgi:hypothetical protein